MIQNSNSNTYNYTYYMSPKWSLQKIKMPTPKRFDAQPKVQQQFLCFDENMLNKGKQQKNGYPP